MIILMHMLTCALAGPDAAWRCLYGTTVTPVRWMLLTAHSL